MSLKDHVSFGTVLPHRSAEPLSIADIRDVARRAENLGFQDLWVTENTLDDNYSYDPFLILTYAAAVTQTIRLGTAVVVLPMHSPIHIAHQTLTLDHISNGRFTLGVGLGRPNDYADFQVPMERRVRRFTEGIALMKALWDKPRVDYRGEIYHLADAGIALRPVQKPHPPLWLGGAHPDAMRRAVRLGTGWMGGGAQPAEDFFRSVSLLQKELVATGRDPRGFGISKRIFLAVDKDPAVAEAELRRWFTEVYRKPELLHSAGVFGTPEQVHAQLEHYCNSGATHLLLNSVSRYEEQAQALAQIVAR